MKEYDYMCSACSGLVMDPTKAYGYAGKVCHCANPGRSFTHIVAQFVDADLLSKYTTLLSERDELREWRRNVCERLGMGFDAGITWTETEVYGHVRDQERRVWAAKEAAEQERDALRDRCNNLEQVCTSANRLAERQQRQIVELGLTKEAAEQRVRELALDAKRYQWLRIHGERTGELDEVFAIDLVGSPSGYLDELIDAAIAAQSAEGESK